MFVKNVQHQMNNMISELDNDTTDFSNYATSLNYPADDLSKCTTDTKNHEHNWVIPQFKHNRAVNYQSVIVRRFKGSKQKDSPLTHSECKVFSNFYKFIKRTLNLESITSFDQYSEQIRQYFFNDPKNDKLPNLKPYLIYVARIDQENIPPQNLQSNVDQEEIIIKGKIATYPSWDVVSSINSPDKRPWGKAVLGTFPSDFLAQDSKFGLTQPYTTNPKNEREDVKANTIRTAWYKFEYEDTYDQGKYVLCIDFFFDTTELYSSNKQVQNNITNSVWEIILAPKRFILWFLIPILFLGAITTWLYRSKDIDINSPQYSELYLEREHRYIADRNEVKVESSVESNIVISQANRSEESKRQGWSAEIVTTTDILNVNANVATERIDTNTNLQQNQEIKKYKIYKTYNLKIETIDSRLKCVELWKAKLKGENTNNIKEIGNFYIEWNNSRSIDSEQDLYIEYHVWNGQYNNIRESIKEQLFCHLLESENRSFIPVRDLDYKSTRQQNILDIIPENLRTKLKQINEIKQLIQQRRINLSLQQRKVALQEYDDVLEIYSLAEINALCCVSFIKKLQSENKLQDWLNNFSQGTIILLVENTPNEFGEFYQNLANDNANRELYSTLKEQTNVRILVYRENSNTVINPQDNFCIVKINNNPSLIMYTPTDEPDAADTIGWISWRKVDINFYTELYDIQKRSRDRKLLKVKSYLSH